MSIAFFLANGAVGTLGSYLVFRRFRNLGLLAAGAALVLGSIVSFSGEQWWMLGLSCILAPLLARLVGDPLEA
jgi:hypothetical protein